jgi:cellulose synthase operon protein C
MRTLNVKAAIIVLIVVVIVVSSTHLLHIIQVSRHSGTLHTMAVAAWNDTPRRDQDAIQSMKSYLALKPKDYKAWRELASWLAQTGHFGAAASRLEELARELEKQKSPDKALLDDVRRDLVQWYMTTLKNWSAAAAHLKVLLAGYPLDHPEQIDGEGAGLLWRLGECQRYQGKEDEAIKSYENALKNPQNRGRYLIYRDLAMSYRFTSIGSLKSLAKGEATMAEMIAVPENAKSPDAHDVYAVWLDELGRPKEALEQAKIALSLKNDDIGGLYMAARCEKNIAKSEKNAAEAEKHVAEAEKYVTQGLKVAPQETPLYVLLADLYINTNRRDEALKIFKQGIEILKSTADKSTLLWHLANIYLDGPGGGIVDAASIAAAKECIRQMEEYRFSPAEIEFLKARVLYAASDWNGALQAFNAVLPKLSNLPARMICLHYWIGYCYYQQGDPDKADYSYHSALKIDPFYFKAHDGIARIYLDQNNRDQNRYKDAVQEYRLALAGNPNDSDAWLAYVGAVVVENFHRKESERDWDFALKELLRAQQHNPSDGRIAQLFAEILAARGREDQAEKLLAALRKDAPKSAESWVGMANLEARHGNLEKAVKLLDDGRAQVGDHYRFRLARATYALRSKGDRAGREIEDLATNIDGYTTDEKIRLLHGLMNDLVDIKEYDRAKRVGRQICLLQPHDAVIRYQLLELALRTHNYREPADSLADIDRLLSEIETVAGQGPLWYYGKAVRLRLAAAREKPESYDRAMKFAAEAQRRRLRWSRPHVLMGEICELQGKPDEALQHYLDASVNGERDLDFNNRLLQMLFQRQRYQDAEQVMRRLERNEVAVSQDIVELETRFEALWGQFDRAVQAAGKGYDPAVEDYRVHLQQGRILRVLAQRARMEGHQDRLPEIVASAEKALRRALEIAPTAADCRVELVLLLMAADQKSKAQKEAAEAEQMIPSETRPVAMGYIYDALGDTEKAGKSYETAFERRPDLALTVRLLAEFYIRNGDAKRAAPLIDKLLNGQLGVTDADLFGARRMKAAMLIQEGYPKFKAALALVEQNLASSQGSREDRRLKAQILLVDPATARSRETLELVEGLVTGSNSEPEPRDRYQLAHLYLRLGKWDECREQMENLVRGQSEPRYLADYVKMLLDQGHLLDAKLWLEKFEKVAQPGDAVPLRAELMFLQKSWGAITPFLTAYLDQAGAVPKDRFDRVAIVAQLFEDFGNRLTAPTERATAQSYFEQAGKLLEENAKSRSEGEMALAAFYARRGRLPAAIERLASGADKATTPQLALAALDMINSEKITPQQLQQVEKILTAAAAARKQPVLLLTALGVLKITAGQTADAEAIYRQIIAANPNNFRAHNNLAVLLALSGKKLDEALVLVNRAIDLVGPLTGLIDSRAVVRIARDEPQRALEDLETILTNPAEKVSPVWLFHKAWALKATGEPDEARDVLRKARLDPYNLDRAKVDSPERAIYDQLIKDLESKE